MTKKLLSCYNDYMLGGDYMYASVIVEITAKAVDKTFTYKVPTQYQNLIKINFCEAKR